MISKSIAPKTAAAGVGGISATALVTILDWLLGFWHITLPAAVAAAFVTIISTVLSYYAPRSPTPPPPVDNEAK